MASNRNSTTSAAPGLGSSAAVERALARFGWLGDADELLASLNISRPRLRALEADDEVSAAIETRRDVCVNTPWRIEHPSARARRALQEIIEPHIGDLMRRIWDATLYGYSVVELVYTAQDDPATGALGRVGIGQIIACPFDWFKLDPAGNLYWPEKSQTQPVDPRHLLAFVRDASIRKPHGEALLAKAWWPWYFRTHGWKFWAKFLEQAAVPLLVGKTDGDRDQLEKALQAVTSGPWLGAGKDDEVAALDVAGGNAGRFADFEQACVRRIQRLILGQTLTSGTDGASGSRALGEVHERVLDSKRRSDMLFVTAGVQRVLDLLAAFNGYAPCRFVMQDETGLEQARAERDKVLMDAGALCFTRRYWEEKYGFEGDDIILPEERAAIAPQPLAAAPGAEFRFAPDGGGIQRPRFTAAQQAIEDEIERTLPRLPPPIEHAAIRSAIMGATDEADLQARLALVLTDADDRGFREQLSRAMYAADVMGLAHAWRNAPRAE